MKTDLFQSCGHCWVFQICWHIEGITFTVSFFRIWNSSTGIPSPPLALVIVMLSKAHLTSHSRMSGSTWVITPSWISWSWRTYLYSSSVYSCHLFLISSASVRSIPSVFYCTHLSMIFSLGISNFLGEISSLSHSVVPLFLCIDCWGSLSYLFLLFFGTLHSDDVHRLMNPKLWYIQIKKMLFCQKERKYWYLLWYGFENFMWGDMMDCQE